MEFYRGLSSGVFLWLRVEPRLNHLENRVDADLTLHVTVRTIPHRALRRTRIW